METVFLTTVHYITILYVSLIFGTAKSSLNYKGFCPTKGDHVNLNCSSCVIHLKEISPPPYKCTPSYSSYVESLEQNIRRNCTQKESCHVTTNNLPTRPYIPIYVTIKYRCRVLIFWRSFSVDVCTDSLDKISCKWGTIEIQEVSQKEYSMCDSGNFNETRKSLNSLCDDRKKCLKSENKHLSHEAYLIISYYCADDSFTMPTEYPDNGFHTSVSTPHSTTMNDETVDSSEDISIDADERNVIVLSWMNKTSTLCAEGWDDVDASVVCKSLGNQSGRAIRLDNRDHYQISPLIFNCNGNEPSLLDCHGNERNCSSDKVAGIECCEELICPLDTSFAKKKDQNSGSSAIGIGVGIPLTVISISVIVFLVVYMKRRNTTTKDKKGNQPRRHIVNQNEDYTGQQGFALPNISRDATNNHNVQYTLASQSESGGSRNQSNVNNAMELYSLASNPNGHDDSTYAASQDGVYDHAHDRRHAESEANTYDHSVHGVYDTSNQQRYDVEGNSSYGRVVDTVYDSSGHGGVPKDNVDNTYSRTVDTSYDTAYRVKRTRLQDNIYD